MTDHSWPKCGGVSSYNALNDIATNPRCFLELLVRILMRSLQKRLIYYKHSYDCIASAFDIFGLPNCCPVCLMWSNKKTAECMSRNSPERKKTHRRQSKDLSHRIFLYDQRSYNTHLSSISSLTPIAMCTIKVFMHARYSNKSLVNVSCKH